MASLDEIKVAVSDTMTDFYDQILRKRFDHLDHEISDLKLTNTALVKIVDYARLEAKVLELEGRLKKLESQKT